MRGKEIRLERIIDRNTRKTIIVPMDHGVTNGPIAGLIDMGEAVDRVAEGGANAVLGHVGLALHGHRKSGRDVGLILHLSASTSIGPDPNNKVLVNSVSNALKMGADAVSMHVNIGADSEARMLTDLGERLPTSTMLTMLRLPHGLQQNLVLTWSRPCIPATLTRSGR